MTEIEARQPEPEPGKKPRALRASTISDIENGKVKRPHAATVKALADALRIPQHEIDACRDPSSGDEMHQREINKLNAYVDALERRLETQKAELLTAHAEERAALQQTIDELTNRLAHPEAAFREYQDKIAQLEQLLEDATGATAAIGANRIADARALLEQGAFEAADEIFAEVQEIEQAAVTRAADAAFARGLIAEEQVRWADAARHYAQAAKLDENFDTIEKAGKLAWQSGDFALAKRFAEDMLAIARREGTQERIDFSLNALAILEDALGRYPEAEGLYRQALEIGKATFGSEHPNYAIGLINLAGVIEAQGRYAEAEGLYRQALEIDKAAIGTAHPGYAIDLNNLAGVVRARGRYAEAEGLYRQALEITKAALGTAHPAYATHLSNLAGVVQAQGRTEEAEGLHRQALEIVTATIGAAHPHYATHLNNLAVVVRAQGRNEEAEGLYRQALEIGEATVGAGHPDYAKNLNNLATLHAHMERFEEALPLIEKALAIYEEKLGPDHPHTVDTRESLAAVRAMMKE